MNVSLISQEAISILEAVSKWADKFDCIEHVYLFGSVPRGNARPDSDVDLMVEYKAKTGEELARFIESYTALQDTYDRWATAQKQIFKRRLSIHDIYFFEPPDATRPAVMKAAKNPAMKIGKAWAVITPPKETKS